MKVPFPSPSMLLSGRDLVVKLTAAYLTRSRPVSRAAVGPVASTYSTAESSAARERATKCQTPQSNSFWVKTAPM